MARRVGYVSGTARKVSQLTGDFDHNLGTPTASRTATRYGLLGTDLGVSIARRGLLLFYFGDSVPAHPDATRFLWSKSVGYVALSGLDPEQPIPMRVAATNTPIGVQYRPPLVTNPDIRLDNFSFSDGAVPSAAIDVEDTIGVFFTQVTFSKSFLAWSSARSSILFDQHYPVSDLAAGGKFTLVSAATIAASRWPGSPPTDGGAVLVYGTPGRDHDDNRPHLAWVEARNIFNRRLGTGSWRYFAGMEAGSQMPVWTHREDQAVPVSNNNLAEASVMYHSGLGLWLLFSYGGLKMYVLSSETPWGPWSEPQVIFDPFAPDQWAWGVFIHCIQPDGTPCNDGLTEDWSAIVGPTLYSPGQSGAPYAPMVIPSLTRPGAAPGQSTIYYAMSTGNPYQTVIMRAGIQAVDEPDPPRWRGNPTLQMTNSGTRGDFEVVVPRQAGGLSHLRRQNDIGPAIPWTWPRPFGDDFGSVDGVAFLQTRVGPNQRLVIARVADRLLSSSDFGAASPLVADGAAVSGVLAGPAVVESTYGAQANNLELVVAASGGGLAHYWQDNDLPALPWHGPIPFAQGD